LFAAISDVLLAICSSRKAQGRMTTKKKLNMLGPAPLGLFFRGPDALGQLGPRMHAFFIGFVFTLILDNWIFIDFSE
jgi:hypothetical protein